MQWLKVQVLNSTYALQSGHTYSVLLIQTLYIQLRYIIIKAADRRISCTSYLFYFTMCPQNKTFLLIKVVEVLCIFYIRGYGHFGAMVSCVFFWWIFIKFGFPESWETWYKMKSRKIWNPRKYRTFYVLCSPVSNCSTPAFRGQIESLLKSNI